MIQSLNDSMTQFFFTSEYWFSALLVWGQVCAPACVLVRALRQHEEW
jgi:hypothetical protein